MEMIPGRTDPNTGARRKFSPVGRAWCPEGVAIFNRWWYSPAVRPEEVQPGLRGFQQIEQEHWEEIQTSNCQQGPWQPFQDGPHSRNRNTRNVTKIQFKQRKQEWNPVTLIDQVEAITMFAPRLNLPWPAHSQ